MPEFYDCLAKEVLMQPQFTKWYENAGFERIERKAKDLEAQRSYHVDVIAYKRGKKYFVDEKNTYLPYGYHEFPIETLSNTELCTKGWLYSSNADHLLWGIRPDREAWGTISEFYLMPFGEVMKRWLIAGVSCGKWELKQTPNFSQEGRIIYHTQFARVLRRDIEAFRSLKEESVQLKLTKHWGLEA